ncbi:MFS transporter [Paenibacillus hexagrammi]|uniref:MFS transporter n=1 Tax=Paenibacillus hexagrammi TaxID=2908839 RepID=A0ABY3SEQ3_9BACL|nr:MFS transporter [Paenibacillus sp. YPD9-1]UJF31719.1 MFS transporter [Paenibacillus sp. YPD9-1]
MKLQVYLYVKAFSDFGTRMDMIAINAMIYIKTGSVFWLSASMICTMIGGILASSASGMAADRLSRKQIMIVSDVLRGLLILLIIPFPDPMFILIVRFASGFVSSFFQVSYTAEIPQIYGSSNVLNINAMISRLSSISMVAGFLVGGLFYEFFGYETVLIVDAISFLVSGIILYKLKWESESFTVHKQMGGFFRQVAGDFYEVTRYFRLYPYVLLVFLVYFVDTFGSASHNLGFPLLAESIDAKKQAMLYGTMWSIWGAGNVLMTYFLPKIKLVQVDLYRAYLISTLFMSLGFVCIFWTTTLPIVLVCAFLTGIADACAMTLQSTIIQQCDNQIRGRIAGVSSLLNSFGFGCGFIAASLLLNSLALRSMVWLMHGFVLTAGAVTLGVYIWMSRKNTIIHGTLKKEA